jgi:hypothetical protein
VLDVGWYELAPAEEGETVPWGIYVGLNAQTEGGDWRLRWNFSNGRPVDGM